MLRKIEENEISEILMLQMFKKIRNFFSICLSNGGQSKNLMKEEKIVYSLLLVADLSTLHADTPVYGHGL